MKVVRNVLKRILPESVRDVYRIAEAHRMAHGQWPHLLRPRTFSDKLCRRLMFDRRPVLTQIADKYAARAYIEERLGSGVLPRLYHVTRDPATIPWDTLPRKYVVKATHGSGWNKLVTGDVDREAMTRQCSQWLRQSYYAKYREWPYKDICPRILIEEFLDDGRGGVPADFKFFVFGGEPAVIQVDLGRFSAHTRAFYDLSWQRLPITLKYPPTPNEVPRPPHLAEMIAGAAKLGRGINFLRVDLYDLPGQFFVGELTTVPEAGREEFKPREFAEALGKRWH